MAVKNFRNKLETLVIQAGTQTVIATILKIVGIIVDKTPVDEGRLRGNWRTDINTPQSGSLEIKDPQGLLAKAKSAAALGSLNLEDLVYFYNNLEYATYIENGTAKLKPSHMVKSTIIDFETEIERQTRKHRIK